MNLYVLLIICIFIGYIIGSVPWALIIGKTFYKTDIRRHGSHNLGGTNAGRVLGRKAGIAVMLGDLSKGVIAFYIVYFILQSNPVSNFEYSLVLLVTLFAAALGHSFPLFANFKGGKIVSIFVGFILCTNYYLLIIGASIFFLTLALTRYVSLSSLVTALSLFLLSLTKFINTSMMNQIEPGWLYRGFLLLFFIFMTIKHRKNIRSLIAGNERKVNWIK